MAKKKVQRFVKLASETPVGPLYVDVALLVKEVIRMEQLPEITVQCDAHPGSLEVTFTVAFGGRWIEVGHTSLYSLSEKEYIRVEKIDFSAMASEVITVGGVELKSWHLATDEPINDAVAGLQRALDQRLKEIILEEGERNPRLTAALA